jgi:hypothetical protein
MRHGAALLRTQRRLRAGPAVPRARRDHVPAGRGARGGGGDVGARSGPRPAPVRLRSAAGGGDRDAPRRRPRAARGASHRARANLPLRPLLAPACAGSPSSCRGSAIDRKRRGPAATRSTRCKAARCAFTSTPDEAVRRGRAPPRRTRQGTRGGGDRGDAGTAPLSTVARAALRCAAGAGRRRDQAGQAGRRDRRRPHADELTDRPIPQRNAAHCNATLYVMAQ